MTENQVEQMMKMMSQSVTTAQETQQIVKNLEQRVAIIEKDVSEIKVGQSRLETDVAELKVGQSRLETDVAELKVGQSRLETDVAELKQGQTRIEKALETNNKAMDSLAGDNIRIKARLDLLEQLPQ